MNRLAGFTLALGALAVAACSGDQTAPTAPAGIAAVRRDATADGSGRVIVSFRGRAADAVAADVAARGGTLEWYHAGTGIGVVSGLAQADAAALPGATQAEADAAVQVAPAADPMVSDESAGDASVSSDGAESQANPATAFFYRRQWNLRAIGANFAWAAGRTGSSSVRVAILDTGIDDRYLDLNGLVDLSRSVSFVPSDDALVHALFPTRSVTTDLHFHGTHVASIVSSKALAVAGVTSRVRLMAVKVLNRNGSGFTSDILRGVLFAADNGADVINMSLGGEFAKAGNGRLIGFINKVFSYAQRQGTLAVVAAGNAHEDLDHNGNTYDDYCNQANVVCVAATGPTAGATNGPWVGVDTPTPYTNYGSSAITVAAPGGYAQPVWGACSTTSLAVPVCRTGTFTLGVSGTSQATPHVSGLAALIVEDVGHGHPQQVRARLMQSADDLGAPGVDPYYGKGRINVKTALGL
jgi:hypothetical protein